MLFLLEHGLLILMMKGKETGAQVFDWRQLPAVLGEEGQ